MDATTCVVIGAGAVGLAITTALSRRGIETVCVERHDAFGRETSSRNSEVIHAGFYYPTNSLKAKLCVKGNRLMYEFCARHNVPHRRCGKLVVARDATEEAKVNHLFEQGCANGVPELSLCGPQRIRALESSIGGTLALWSPSTGIFDSHTFMKRLEQQAQESGATIAYNCEVTGIMKRESGYEVVIRDVDGSSLNLACKQVINAAGLHADRIAGFAGIDSDAAGYRIHFCKGEYFSVSNRHKGKLTHLVYPAPTTISLGIHGVLSLDGNLKLGPSAFYVDALNYDVNPAHGKDFYTNAKTLFPFLEEHDLSPDMAGIRPKLQGPGDSFRDFVIRDEANRGLPGFINLIGIESPGLTSALSIARYVESIIDGTAAYPKTSVFSSDPTD
jgi:L-2-hydroxyglutarate oxidase LhgO